MVVFEGGGYKVGGGKQTKLYPLGVLPERTGGVRTVVVKARWVVKSGVKAAESETPM